MGDAKSLLYCRDLLSEVLAFLLVLELSVHLQDASGLGSAAEQPCYELPGGQTQADGLTMVRHMR